MTKSEQDALLKLGRLNRDGAKAAAKRRTAELVANCEARLAASFSFDQREVWANLMRTAQARVAELDRDLADDCHRLGIPESFRPSLNLYWGSRGENASKERRAELRRVIATRAVALERAALEAIEEGARRFATDVLTAGISTDEARALLVDLPTAEQLMPPLDYPEIERALLRGPEAAALSGDQALPTDLPKLPAEMGEDLD